MLVKLGSELVTLPFNRDIAPAFNENRLDANFNITPLTGIFLVQPRPATIYHHPGVHNPSYLLDLLIGADTWNAMAEPQRRLLDDACRRNLDRWIGHFPSSQNDVLNRIRSERITVEPFPPAVQQAMRRAATEAFTEESAKNPRFKEALDSYNRFRR